MIMSNELVQTGIKGILNKLSAEELHGLIATVTQGLLREKTKSKQEAIEVILKYSPDSLSILKRRIITKDILFTYLHDNNVKVELPTTKDKLITKLYEVWNIPRNGVKELNVEKVESNAEPTASQEITSPPEDNVNVMAQQFSQWFYEMMNHNECINPDHFYPDAHIKLNIISEASVAIEETENPVPIVELLLKVRKEHDLFFNPNLNHEGSQGRIDPHGLVMIMTCGTLHSNNVCVGVFEQVFALARDPFCDNNWKIKHTELNLRSKSGNEESPNLSNNDLTSKLLALPET